MICPAVHCAAAPVLDSAVLGGGPGLLPAVPGPSQGLTHARLCSSLGALPVVHMCECVNMSACISCVCLSVHV